MKDDVFISLVKKNKYKEAYKIIKENPTITSDISSHLLINCYAALKIKIDKDMAKDYLQIIAYSADKDQKKEISDIISDLNEFF